MPFFILAKRQVGIPLKAFFSWLVIIFILVLAIVIGAQNDQWVTVNYLIAATQMHLSAVIAIAMLLGIIITLLLFSTLIIKLRWQNKRLQKMLKKFQHSANE
ncbi:lipopolysaccharide assembly protein LapA domain-containing protein [Alteromonadaceae bacterium BrNp21-10]|nr:lipopolysaccharide assembly protein LapA domain-containing protein [Alteromonadaceae bacterium BrNp21-10]